MQGPWQDLKGAPASAPKNQAATPPVASTPNISTPPSASAPTPTTPPAPGATWAAGNTSLPTTGTTPAASNAPANAAFASTTAPPVASPADHKARLRGFGFMMLGLAVTAFDWYEVHNSHSIHLKLAFIGPFLVVTGLAGIVWPQTMEKNPSADGYKPMRTGSIVAGVVAGALNCAWVFFR